MAILYRVQDLQKGTLRQMVISDKVATFSDAGKQIALWTKLNDNESAIHGVHNAHQGYHIGMLAGHVMQADFPLLELALPGIEPCFVQCFDGIWDVGVDVYGAVDYTIGTHTQDAR